MPSKSETDLSSRPNVCIETAGTQRHKLQLPDSNTKDKRDQPVRGSSTVSRPHHWCRHHASSCGAPAWPLGSSFVAGMLAAVAQLQRLGLYAPVQQAQACPSQPARGKQVWTGQVLLGWRVGEEVQLGQSAALPVDPGPRRCCGPETRAGFDTETPASVLLLWLPCSLCATPRRPQSGTVCMMSVVGLVLQPTCCGSRGRGRMAVGSYAQGLE